MDWRDSKMHAHIKMHVYLDMIESNKNYLQINILLKKKFKCLNSIPVRLWRPAPRVDKNEPIKITHSFGHASLATTKPPLMLSPNLQYEKSRHWEKLNVSKKLTVLFIRHFFLYFVLLILKTISLATVWFSAGAHISPSSRAS